MWIGNLESSRFILTVKLQNCGIKLCDYERSVTTFTILMRNSVVGHRHQYTMTTKPGTEICSERFGYKMTWVSCDFATIIAQLWPSLKPYLVMGCLLFVGSCRLYLDLQRNPFLCKISNYHVTERVQVCILSCTNTPPMFTLAVVKCWTAQFLQCARIA